MSTQKHKERIEEVDKAMHKAEKLMTHINAETVDMRQSFANDMKALHQQVQEKSTYVGDKSTKEWYEKTKRADFNKPAQWGDNNKDYSFERFRAAIKR